MITKIDKNTALIIIDLQKGIVRKYLTEQAEKVIKNAARLAEIFREKELPVIAVSVNPIGAAWTLTRKEISDVPATFVTRNLAKGAMKITGFTDYCIPLLNSDLCIEKHTWNAFFETGLHTELQKLAITQIVLAGVSTSIGVEGTARAAAELGYNIAFATDASLDTNPEARQNSIKNIFPRLGECGTTEEIIKKL